MTTTAERAEEFVRRAQGGERPRARVRSTHAAAFLEMLAREGVRFARECLDQITDPELRRVIETLFFATAGGAALGASVGAMVAGPAGAKVGTVVGALAGFAAGCVALTITVRQEGDYVMVQLA